jgi:tRNA 2-thiouridine synthesizing protein A
MTAPTILDVRGLKCPLPVLRAKRAMQPLAPGEALEVHATDPGAVPDLRAFCATTGNHFEGATETAGVFVITIRKAP